LGGNYSSPSAINNLGQVVGDAGLANGDSHAFLWQKGQMVDLNTLLPSNSGWELFSAEFINDSGRIVGTGLHNGTNQWFVMDLASGNNPPVAIAGPDQTVECSLQVTLDGSHSSDPAAGTLLGVGVYSLAITVTDASGNSATTNSSFSVADTTAPTIVSTPAPITVSADANCQGAVPNVLPEVVAADNCTPTNQLVMTQSLPPARCSASANTPLPLPSRISRATARRLMSR
jgi:probable HAF family extracellular repeat protein